ncbi:MAG: hypothetical protein ACTSRB_09955, partial [Candidatus Helarchaeota archaeon]
TDLMNGLEINPMKAVSGILDEIMPLIQSMTSATSSGSGAGSINDLDATLAALNNTLWASGLKEMIFTDPKWVLNTVLNLSIQDTFLNLKLMGFELKDVPISLDLPLNLTEFIGGATQGNATIGNASVGFQMPEISITDLDLELSTFNGPFTMPFKAMKTDSTGTVTIVPNVEVTYGFVDYDLITETSYFNVTIYNATQKNLTPGWYNRTGTQLPYAYINDLTGPENSTAWNLTHTDENGLLNISGEISIDTFGWVQPYIYIHVDPVPGDAYPFAYYWWNVTTTPAQTTLNGTTPEDIARWIFSGEDIKAEDAIFNKDPDGYNVTNVNTTNYEDPANQSNLVDPIEIFARIPVDNTTMSVQVIHYIERGSIQGIYANHSSALFGNTFNSYLYNETVKEEYQNWTVSAVGGQEKAVYEQWLSPGWSKIVYPQSTRIITDLAINSENWVDDSLTRAVIYYFDINDSSFKNPIYLLDWNLRDHAVGSYSESVVYDENFATIPDETSDNWWVQNDPYNDTFFFRVLENDGTAQGWGDYSNYRIGDLNIKFENFSMAALKNLTVKYRVHHSPVDPNPYWITAYQYNGQATTRISHVMSRDTTHRKDPMGNPMVYGENYANGTAVFDTHLTPLFDGHLSYYNGTDEETEWRGCYSGIFNYTYDIPKDGYVTRIAWLLKNEDGDPGFVNNHGGMEVINITAYDATNQQWVELKGNDVGISYGTRYSPLSSVISDTITQQPGGSDALYLTSRGLSATENYTKINFVFNFTDGNYQHTNGSWLPVDSLGWNNTANASLSEVDVYAQIEITKIYFYTSWDDDFELPEGFISGFDISAEMYDPLDRYDPFDNTTWPGANFTISYNVYPRVTKLQDLAAYLPGNFTIDGDGYLVNDTLLASKIYVRLEMEDSVVNDDVKGARGDVLYDDANRPFGTLWTALNSSFRPFIMTNITSFDLETTYQINVSIASNQALKSYYLNLTIGNPRGYLQQNIERLTQYIVGNTKLNSKISLFAPKSIISYNNDTGTAWAETYRLGTTVDIDPYSSSYTIVYNLRVQASPSYVHAWNENPAVAPIRIYFSGWWKEPESTFHVINRYDTEPLSEGWGGQSQPYYREIYISTTGTIQ